VNSDQELMSKVQQGDAHAFELLFERYEDLIRTHLLSIVQEDAVAQDLLQEVFLRVWTRASQWKGSGAFRSWLYRIATNLAINHLRNVRRRREQPLEVNEITTESDESDFVPAWVVDASALGPDQLLDIAEMQVIFHKLIEDLSAEKQAVFRLVHTLEMTTADAAEELGIPEGTVKSRLYYAKKLLAEGWQGYHENQE